MRVRFGIVAALLVLSAVSGLPVAGQSSPAPVSGAEILGRAIDGLDELESFRYELRTTTSRATDGERVDDGTVVNGRPDRMQGRSGPAGEPSMEHIYIGGRGWMRRHGSAWQAMRDLDWPVPRRGEWVHLGASLGRLPHVATELTLVGPEDRDGTATLHYRGETTDPRPSPGEDLTHDDTFGVAFDLWVDAARGTLVAAELHTRWRDYVLPKPPLTSYEVHDQVTISHVDDPANTIGRPSLEPLVIEPIDGADASLAPMVTGAFDALGELDSWRATIEDTDLEPGMHQELIVVNGPVPAVEWTEVYLGDPRSGGRLIGDDRWQMSRGGTVWEPMPVEETHCGSSRCDFAELTALDEGIDAIAATFAVVEGDTALDGTPAIHLRSRSGAELKGFGAIPGTTDLWIATDDGALLRRTFDGVGLSSSVTIHHVNDPTNVVEPPV